MTDKQDTPRTDALLAKFRQFFAGHSIGVANREAFLLGLIDEFINAHRGLETELTALRAKLEAVTVELSQENEYHERTHQMHAASDRFATAMIERAEQAEAARDLAIEAARKQMIRAEALQDSLAAERDKALEDAAEVCDEYARRDNPNAVTISMMAAAAIRALKSAAVHLK